MKYSTFIILIFFFFGVPFSNLQAIMAPSLAVNENLKECRTYQPLSHYSLPEEWKYLYYDKSNYKSTHKTKCEEIGYTYNPEMLKGNIDPAYQATFYTFHSIALLLLLIQLALYLKTKKKKILIAIPITIIVYLAIYGIFTFNIG
jgi:hypothetical protein